MNVSEYRVLAFRYGLLPPEDWTETCERELLLQNRLWNALVQIECQHRARFRALVNQAPQVDSKIAMKEARYRFRDELRELNEQRFAQIKAARRTSGLWWSNYNAVCASFETSRSRTIRSGREFANRPFLGTGRFTCQLQGGATWEDLQSGRCRAVRVEAIEPDAWEKPRAERRRLSRTRLSITVRMDDGRRTWLTFPMIMHRPLPKDCRVQRVVVVRRRLGTRWHYSAVFFLRVSHIDAARTRKEGVCAINLGFRRTVEGLRVATLVDSSGRDFLHLSDGWVRKARRIEQLGRGRMRALMRIQAWLRTKRGEIGADSFPEDLRSQWFRLALEERIEATDLWNLTREWQQRASTALPHLRLQLEAWRRLDRRMLNEQAHLRKKLEAQRTERYRLLARRLAMSYGTIAVGRIDLRRIADLRREWDDGPRLHPSARWRRQQAALSSLVAECRNQCEKSGTDLKFCRGPFTRTCFGCGARQSVSDSALLHRCSECSGVWDQDENAARNILRIASAEGTVHGPSARGSTSAGMDAIPPANQSRAPPSELGIYILKE